ncbi:MAG: hypothetical protein VB027_07400 [Gordonibacter sp.]|nr:hypothetical protein [Gordonibacter sp.]
MQSTERVDEPEGFGEDALSRSAGNLHAECLSELDMYEKKRYYYEKISEPSNPCDNFLVSYNHDYAIGNCTVCAYYEKGGYCSHPSMTVVEDWPSARRSCSDPGLRS